MNRYERISKQANRHERITNLITFVVNNINTEYYSTFSFKTPIHTNIRIVIHKA